MDMKRRTPRLIAAAAMTVAAGGVGALATPDPAGASAPLRVHASAIGLDIGVAVDPHLLIDDDKYRAIVATEFNSITPRNTFTWEVVQPTRGQFNFSSADLTVQFAQHNTQTVRGNPLLWHSQNPGWVQNLSGSALQQAMNDHIATVVGRYQGHVHHWDVVNEPLADDGSLRNSFWLQGLGPDYIADALQFARQVDPQAKLYLNDDNIAGINAKSNAMFQLAQDLLAGGVPLDGIGIHGRFIAGNVPASLAQNLQRFVNLGLEVSITQLEVQVPLPVDQPGLQQQAADYRSVVETCIAVTGCAGVTVWGVADPTNGIPWPVTGYGGPLLWDGNYQPKPAYYAVHDALAGAAPAPRQAVTPR